MFYHIKYSFKTNWKKTVWLSCFDYINPARVFNIIPEETRIIINNNFSLFLDLKNNTVAKDTITKSNPTITLTIAGIELA